MKAAVIVVDMINDFVTGVLKCKRAPRIIPNIKRLLDFSRKTGIPIIYTNDAHLPNVDAEFKLWPPHAVVGTKGAEVIDELKPAESDFIVRKRRYSAFYETDLDLLLRELKVDTLVVVGLVTDICVQHTVADAFFRGYRIIIPKDCVEALTEEAQERGIKYLQRIYGCEITTVSDLMEKGIV